MLNFNLAICPRFVSARQSRSLLASLLLTVLLSDGYALSQCQLSEKYCKEGTYIRYYCENCFLDCAKDGDKDNDNFNKCLKKIEDNEGQATLRVYSRKMAYRYGLDSCREADFMQLMINQRLYFCISKPCDDDVLPNITGRKAIPARDEKNVVVNRQGNQCSAQIKTDPTAYDRCADQCLDQFAVYPVLTAELRNQLMECYVGCANRYKPKKFDIRLSFGNPSS